MKSTSLYEDYKRQISDTRSRDAARPGSFRRNIFNESQFLQGIAREMVYTPPSPRHLPAVLKNIDERRATVNKERDEANAKIDTRMKELTAEHARLSSLLDTALYTEAITVVEAAMTRLAAVNHLIAAAPSVMPRDTMEEISANKKTRQTEIDGLRRWYARLRYVEEPRIKAALETAPEDGATHASYSPSRLYSELEAVILAASDAETNLHEVNAPVPRSLADVPELKEGN